MTKPKTPTVAEIARFFNVETRQVILNEISFFDRVQKEFVKEFQVKVQHRTRDLQNWSDPAGGDAASQGSGQAGDNGSPDAHSRGSTDPHNR